MEVIEKAVRRKLEMLASVPPVPVNDTELEELLEDNGSDDIYFSLRGETGVVIHVPLCDTAIAAGLTQAGNLLYTYVDADGQVLIDREFTELDEDTRSWLWAALQE